MKELFFQGCITYLFGNPFNAYFLIDILLPFLQCLYQAPTLHQKSPQNLIPSISIFPPIPSISLPNQKVLSVEDYLLLQYFYFPASLMRNCKSSLKNIRVLKKNMLFIQSYDEQLNRSMLTDQSMYEICGEVEKIKVKENYKNHTAYVTYRSTQAAATAFIAFYQIDHRMKILFGTVQYCKYFTRKSQCRNEHCVFLHLRDKKNEIVVDDQIDEDAYDDHYDMAVKIAQDEAFQTMKRVISRKQENCQNILRKGIIKAAELFHLMPEAKSEVLCLPNRKLSELQESLASTTEQSLAEVREQPCPAQPLSEKHPKPIQPAPDCPSAQSPQPQQSQKKEFVLGEYIYIQLIKKLIRENKSKMHTAEQVNREQIHRRGNMMLYKIVKK